MKFLRRIFLRRNEKTVASKSIRQCWILYQEIYKISQSLIGKQNLHKPIAIMTTYNDVDIIEGIVTANIDQGQELILVDNWSTDGTWELIKKLSKNHREILKIYRYPLSGPSSDYNWKELLKFKEEIALHYPNRWILHQDSDEVTLSPFVDIELKYVFEAVRLLGCNCVTLRMLDFTPVDDLYTSGNPVDYFKYYRYITKFSYDRQQKIWLQKNERVNLHQHAGHDVLFKDKEVFSVRFPRLHYSVRSTTQLLKKYSHDRKTRIEKERKAFGWHTHIESRISEKVVYEKEELILFDRSNLYYDYFKWFVL